MANFARKLQKKLLLQFSAAMISKDANEKKGATKAKACRRIFCRMDNIYNKFLSKMKKHKKKVQAKNKLAENKTKETKKIFSLKSTSVYVAVIFLIVLAAFFIRTHNLSSIPPGVYPDEAVNGADAISAIESQNYKLFYVNNNGREGLFMNLIAIGFQLFGISVVTLKMWSVLAGTLTVLGMILLGEELLQSRRAGIVAGFLTATSFWAINFSRISFRAILLPFVLVFTIYFLVRGIQKNKIFDYILAGVFFGLGVHTYIAFRIAPIILIVLLAAFLISRKRFLATHWKPISAFILATFLVALPMLADFYANPDHFSARTSEVSVFNPVVNQGNLLKAVGISFGMTMGEFNFYGDHNWRHNLPTQPELFPVVGIFFLAGLFYFIYEFFFLLYRRIVRGQRSERFIPVSLLLAWFFAMIIPAVMTFEGLPHALRSIGAMPVAILLAVFAIEATFKWTEKNRETAYKKAAYGILILAILASGIISLKYYFIDWGQSQDVRGAFNQNFMNMANYINALPKNTPKYIVDNGPGKPMEDGLQTSAEVIRVFTYGKTANLSYIKPDFDTNEIKIPSKIFLMSYSEEIINRVKAAFPNSQGQKIDLQPGYGTDFTVIDIK